MTPKCPVCSKNCKGYVWRTKRGDDAFSAKGATPYQHGAQPHVSAKTGSGLNARTIICFVPTSFPTRTTLLRSSFVNRKRTLQSSAGDNASILETLFPSRAPCPPSHGLRNRVSQTVGVPNQEIGNESNSSKCNAGRIIYPASPNPRPIRSRRGRASDKPGWFQSS